MNPFSKLCLVIVDDHTFIWLVTRSFVTSETPAISKRIFETRLWFTAVLRGNTQQCCRLMSLHMVKAY